MLSDEEKQRYDRQMMVRGIGEEGQEKLKKARVVIAGAGGLGTPSALYLAAAGVGTIRIVDSDRVELSNLNRQILHWNKDIGRNKTDSAAEKLRDINNTIQIEAIAETIDEESVARLTAGFDVILDGTDNLETRFLLNSAALANGIPFVHGAVYGFEGRVTTVLPGKTPCLGCIYRGTIPQQKSPVVGVTPGLVGVLQATETIKYIVGVGQLLTNQLLVYNGLRMRFNTLAIKRDPNCKYCRGINEPDVSGNGPDPSPW
jgi:molybdopterin/thiamine biosynthesis adenylyltransferase